MNPVKKQNYTLNAEIKTISDYALILQYCNGYNREDAQQGAMESGGDELFELLLKRNLELFKTGDVIMFGSQK